MGATKWRVKIHKFVYINTFKFIDSKWNYICEIRRQVLHNISHLTAIFACMRQAFGRQLRAQRAIGININFRRTGWLIGSIPHMEISDFRWANVAIALQAIVAGMHSALSDFRLLAVY